MFVKLGNIAPRVRNEPQGSDGTTERAEGDCVFVPRFLLDAVESNHNKGTLFCAVYVCVI